MINFRKLFATLVAACAFILSFSPALSNNGMVVATFPFQETVFVPCLNEEVFADEWVELRSHSFSTPSGNSHSMLKFDVSSDMTGLTTGRMWRLEKLSVSWPTNSGKGETSQIQAHGVVKPISPGAPILIWDVDFKITVTANGDVVVSRPNNAFNDVRCLDRG